MDFGNCFHGGTAHAAANGKKWGRHMGAGSFFLPFSVFYSAISFIHSFLDLFILPFLDLFIPFFWLHWITRMSVETVRLSVTMEIPESMKKLMKTQEDVESEMEGLANYLTAPGMPGLAGNLVDAEGFPRADLDLYAVRGARHRLAQLRTQHKEVMGMLQRALEEIHSNAPATPDDKQQTPPPMHPLTQSKNYRKAAVLHSQFAPLVFATVGDLAVDSPAQRAGLRIGDHILRMGSIFLRGYEPLESEPASTSSSPSSSSSPSASSASSSSPSASSASSSSVSGCALVGDVFASLAAEVSRHRGAAMAVDVLRVGEPPVGLRLTPEKFAGDGLLGCRLVPFYYGKDH
eukprot:GHVT01064632.1.p1 GENE.GHVT01064632.1~~GHVT01064632.1.p1  ORF type:complete len:347 (+),score=86.85 GHVT01064632.1:738-1778(+)